jgi:hypothetical protein
MIICGHCGGIDGHHANCRQIYVSSPEVTRVEAMFPVPPSDLPPRGPQHAVPPSDRPRVSTIALAVLATVCVLAITVILWPR